jgi:hypothetical protein
MMPSDQASNTNCTFTTSDPDIKPDTTPNTFHVPQDYTGTGFSITGTCGSLTDVAQVTVQYVPRINS